MNTYRRDNRTLMKANGTAAKGAFSAAALLLLLSQRTRLRPFVITALRELHGFKEWLLRNAEMIRDELEDLNAEAKHEQELSAAKRVDLLEREKVLRERIEVLLEERRAKDYE